jgi:hypothetical protein
MKDKLAKKDFIKNFEYFKRNPEEYDKKRNSKYFKVTMFLIAPMIVMLTALVFPLFLIPHWYIYLMGIYAAVTVPSILIIMVIYDFKNMKAITFDNMIYKGKLTDLFDDLNHPAIVKAKHLIESDIERKGGLSGGIAYYIYEEMNNPEYAVKTVDLKSSDEKVTMALEIPEEIENK